MASGWRRGSFIFYAWSTHGTSGWRSTPGWQTRWSPHCCSCWCPGPWKCGRLLPCRWLSAGKNHVSLIFIYLLFVSLQNLKIALGVWKSAQSCELVFSWILLGVQDWERVRSKVTYTQQISEFILQKLFQLLLVQSVLVSLLTCISCEGGDEEGHGVLDIRHDDGLSKSAGKFITKKVIIFFKFQVSLVYLKYLNSSRYCFFNHCLCLYHCFSYSFPLTWLKIIPGIPPGPLCSYFILFLVPKATSLQWHGTLLRKMISQMNSCR